MKTYRQRVYDFCENMEEGVTYYIPDFVKGENYTIFVKVVKEWMDNEAPHMNYNFSDDYKELLNRGYYGMDFKPRHDDYRRHNIRNFSAVGEVQHPTEDA